MTNSTPEPVPGWRFDTRADGLKVAFYPQAPIHKYVITESDGTVIATECPCCGLPFPNRRAAALVANSIRKLEPRDG